MKLFDTHFHYYKDCSPREYYKAAEERGVGFLLAAAGSYDETLDCKDFAGELECAWYATGVHPHQAEKFADDISRFEEFKGLDKLVAVGEIGLDYFYENSGKKEQLKVFEDFLNLALEWKLPAIVHCRDKENCEEAYEHAYGLLKDFAGNGGTFEVHCFTGTIPWAEKFLELGAWIGVTGIITFPKAQNVRDALKIIPDEKLLLETDSPYLSPVPFRGKTNHSMYLKEVAERAAQERGVSFEEIAEKTTANAFSFFNIKQ
jgi:TatD DNase family protein